MDHSNAVGDKKSNLPGAGARQDSHHMLATLLSYRLDMASDRLTEILEQMDEARRDITRDGFKLIEELVSEAIRLRDQQTVAAVQALPGSRLQ